jgi:hypothetical protein
MKKMIITSWNTGETLKKVALKYPDRSVTYKVEYLGARKYLVIRDYYTNDILQKIDVNNYGSIEFRIA